ncbi:MAG TPA: family 20 glycosylhydrolase [Bacteroidales bacterium]|nr:family 20 glycosylhydrolase [Bacteroidales bacterium]
MKTKLLLILLLASFCLAGNGQEKIDSLLPVRGLCIAAPKPSEVAAFIEFIRKELVPGKINTLILRIDYNYRFESHPELSDSDALTKSDVKKIVRICRENSIRIIPQIDLLGHQSWASKPGALLRVYPEFDETPGVKFPEKYAWPNADKLYCKSYCPLHPGVHDVVFAVMDELCDVYETDSFHAGMDEVFYLGEDQCPRCSGRDKAELFAGEVTLLRNHLAQKSRHLWIWGDRLLDGKTTGLGEWEASFNNTSRAIDLIPKDVTICDWHYERAEQTAVYFAMKGFDVVTCPWRESATGLQQLEDMLRYRRSSTPEMKARFRGIVQTQWSDATRFIESYYGKGDEKRDKNAGSCFRGLINRISVLSESK